MMHDSSQTLAATYHPRYAGTTQRPTRKITRGLRIMRYDKPKRTAPKEPPAEIQELVDPGTEGDSPKVINKAARPRRSRPAGPNRSSKSSGKAPPKG